MCDVGEGERLGVGTGWPAEEVWHNIQLPGSVLDVKGMALQFEGPAHQFGMLVANVSNEVNAQSRPSPVLRRSTEKGPSRIRQGRGPPSLSYCGSSSKWDVLHHPQPGTKLHPDKSRKHQLLQKKASHNWVVAVLDGTPNVNSGPRR